MNSKEMRVFQDGNCWCFVLPDFKNLQESPAVFTDPDNVKLDEVYDELINQDWEEKDTLVHLGDKEISERCWDCGSNVFRFSKDHKRIRCNGCLTIYEVS